MREAKTVTQMTSYIKNMFTRDEILKSVLVKGEISNCKYAGSGHIYFTLKDEWSAMQVVMFRGNRLKGLDFALKDGQKVIVAGEINVYEKDGVYQLYSKMILLDGVGKLFEELENRKRKYQEEGLFDERHKKKIPRFPSKIGVVTAATGAVIQDILKVARRRNPYVELILCPAKVQGKGAAETIARGIKRLEKEKVDVMIIGRGGGSIEDLWCFNEDIVVRTIFECNTPIISAVGHATDTTLADLVADVRVVTPSEAAEKAVPDISVTLSELAGIETAIRFHIREKLKYLTAVLEKMELQILKESPGYKLREYMQRTDEVEDKMRHLLEKKLSNYKEKLSSYNFRMMLERTFLMEKNKFHSYKINLLHKMKMKYGEVNRRFLVLAEKLDGQSPVKRLTGGYSYIENESGENIKSIKKVKVRDVLHITVMDGKIKAKVEEVE